MKEEQTQSPKKGILLFRILGKFIVSLLLLVLLLLVAVQLPFVQNWAKDYAVEWLAKKLNTQVEVQRFRWVFPGEIGLYGTQIAHPSGQDFVAIDTLSTSISLTSLLNQTISLDQVQLYGIDLHLQRDKDSVFNFQFLVDAFASSDTTQTESKPWAIHADQLDLKRWNFTYDDQITQQNAALQWQHIGLSIDEIDIVNSKYVARELTISDFKGQYKQGLTNSSQAETKVQSSPASASTTPLSILIKNIDLQKVDLVYADANSQLDVAANLDRFTAQIEALDLENQRIKAKQIKGDLRSTAVQIASDTTVITEPKAQEQSVESSVGLPAIPMPWTLDVAEIQLNFNELSFHNSTYKKLPQGFDFNHIDLTKLNLHLKDIWADSTRISAHLKQLNLSTLDNWQLINCSTKLAYNPNQLSLTDFHLKTNSSSINNQTQLDWPTNEKIGQALLSLELNDTQIAVADLVYLVPGLKKQPVIANFATSTLQLNTTVQGKVGDFEIPQLTLSGLGNTQFSGNARIKNVQDIDRLYIDLNIHSLETSAQDLYKIMPKGTLPADIKLPPSLRLMGKIKGSLQNLTTQLALATTWGGARIQGSYATTSQRTSYDLQAKLNQLQLNRFMPTSGLGAVDGNAKIVGQGTELGKIKADANVALAQFGFNGYTYRDIELKAKLNQQFYEMAAVSRDTNAQLQISSEGVFKNQLPAGALQAEVQFADLQALGFYTSPLRLRTKLEAQLGNLHPDSLDISGYITHLSVANLNKQVNVDSIQLEGYTRAGQSRLLLDSPFLDINASGQFRYDALISAISRTMNSYLNKPAIAIREEEIVAQQMDLQIKGTPHEFWHMVLPELTDMEPFTGEIAYVSNPSTEAIVGSIYLPHAHLGANKLDHLRIDLAGNNKQLAYEVSLANFENEQLKLNKTALEGDLVEGQLRFDLGIQDAEEKQQFQLAGNIDLSQNTTAITLNPEGAILNYQTWDIPKENRIEISEQGIYIDQLALIKGQEGIVVQSLSAEPNAPISVQLDQFDLGILTQMVLQPEMQINGVASGEIELRNLSQQLVFVGDLSIDAIQFNQQDIGNLQLTASNQVANRYDFTVALTGFDNQMDVTGYFDSANSSFDADIDIQSLQFQTLQRLAPALLADAKGNLYGNLKASGSTQAPVIVGELGFNEVGTTIIPLDTYYEINPQTISFSQRGISFNQFELLDSSKNDLVIDGNILTNNYRDFTFDLRVDANDFKAIDAPDSSDNLYYGKLVLDSNLLIRGTLEAPIVNGSLSIDEGSDFTVVLPQSDPRIADREGIIVFVDKDASEHFDQALFHQEQLMEQLAQSANLQGMDVNVNVKVDQEAKLTLVIDKGNGDFLELRGEAELNAGIDPSGKVNLTGRYELTEGAYEMSFNFLKRKFKIQKGSYLLWTGEPTSATVDITAIYESQTAPIDLLNQQLAGESALERNKYRQRLPFQTKLIMKGELMKPEITFDIDLPDKNYGVSSDIVEATRNKLEQIRQDEAELNKQVFALLILNRFVGENPFESSGSGLKAETMARQSVSKILSQQLNNMAADIIDGFELNFDVESTEDFTSGEMQNRTDLNVELSKKMFDDRLTVTVGSSFGLEGEQQDNQRANTIAGDISATYQITADGRYSVRAYRKDEYQVAIQGQVIETGVAFTITMDYDRFVELFRKSREEKEIIQEKKRKKEREKERAQREKEKKREAQDKTVNEQPEKDQEDEQEK